MLNDTINVVDGYSDSIMCENETSVRCNISNHTDDDFNEELIINCRYYLEGIALTPISVFGMLGEPSLTVNSEHQRRNLKRHLRY